MKHTIGRGLEKSFSFINLQLQPGGPPSQAHSARRRFVTLSRQGGCAAHAVGEKLAEILQRRDPGPRAPWTVFDRELVIKMLEDHHLPQRLAEFMPEDRVSEITDIMDEVFDLRPSSWSLVEKGCETALRLAELGDCILIGRGANFITRRLKQGFHVRLIGSVERRAQMYAQGQKVSFKEARAAVLKQDSARAKYVKKYFREDVDDPLNYDLLLNVDHFSVDAAAQVIAEGLLHSTVPE